MNASRVGRYAVMSVAVMLLAGCTLIEGVGRALVIAGTAGQAPAQIESFAASPMTVLLTGVQDPFCMTIFLPGSTEVMWTAVAKRVQLLLGASLVSERTTTDIMERMTAQQTVPVPFLAGDTLTLRAFNALDTSIEQQIALTVLTIPPFPTPGCMCPLPPCCPNPPCS